MSKLVPSASFEYLCYGSTHIVNILIHSVRGPDRLLTSESDIYSRQILMYKVGPSTVRVLHHLKLEFALAIPASNE